MATASLQPIIYVLRVHEDGGQLGDPYYASCTVLRIGDASCELIGYSSRIRHTAQMRRAVFKALREAGFDLVGWERKTKHPHSVIDKPTGSSGKTENR